MATYDLDAVCQKVCEDCGNISGEALNKFIANVLCDIRAILNGGGGGGAGLGASIACADTDGRLLLLTNDAGVITITNIDGSPILDGAQPINCDREFKYVERCWQDITDNSIRYTQLVCIDTANPTTNLIVIWFDDMGNNLGTTQPANSEPCPEVGLPQIQEVTGCLVTNSTNCFGNWTDILAGLTASAALDVGGEAALYLDAAPGTPGNLSAPFTQINLLNALNAGPSGPGWSFDANDNLCQDPLVAVGGGGFVPSLLEISPGDNIPNVQFASEIQRTFVTQDVKVIQAVNSDLDGSNIQVLSQSVFTFPDLVPVTLPVQTNQELRLNCNAETPATVTTPECYFYFDENNIRQEVTAYAEIDDDANFIRWVVTSGQQPSIADASNPGLMQKACTSSVVCPQCPGAPPQFPAEAGNPDDSAIQAVGPLNIVVTGSGTAAHSVTIDNLTPAQEVIIDRAMTPGSNCLALIRSVSGPFPVGIIGFDFFGGIMVSGPGSRTISGVDHTAAQTTCAAAIAALVAVATDAANPAAGNSEAQLYCIQDRPVTLVQNSTCNATPQAFCVTWVEGAIRQYASIVFLMDGSGQQITDGRFFQGQTEVFPVPDPGSNIRPCYDEKSGEECCGMVCYNPGGGATVPAEAIRILEKDELGFFNGNIRFIDSITGAFVDPNDIVDCCSDLVLPLNTRCDAYNGVWLTGTSAPDKGGVAADYDTAVLDNGFPLLVGAPRTLYYTLDFVDINGANTGQGTTIAIPVPDPNWRQNLSAQLNAALGANIFSWDPLNLWQFAYDNTWATFAIVIMEGWDDHGGGIQPSTGLSGSYGIRLNLGILEDGITVDPLTLAGSWAPTINCVPI